jgi:NitT/TauT family transport system substrate-binding protein
VSLKKGAEKELGDPKKLDSLLVAMAHPEGVQNLLSGQIAGHFTSPPFQFQELEQGAHTVFHIKYGLGVTTFNFVYTTRKFYDDYPAFVQKFYDYVKKATDLIHNEPDRAATIIATADNRPADAAKYKGWITHEGLAYTLKPSGFLVQAEFMKQIGLIPKTPSTMKEIELPPLQALGGS